MGDHSGPWQKFFFDHINTKGSRCNTRMNGKRILETRCWEWTGRNSSDFGYGIMQCNHKRILTHRIGYEMFVGPIPEGMCVLHKCDNPKCVRGEHLFLGTYKDNAEDRDRKGRNGKTKYTDQQVSDVRRLHEAGYRTIDIQAMTGVTKRQIRNIIYGGQRKFVVLAP